MAAQGRAGPKHSPKPLSPVSVTISTTAAPRERASLMAQKNGSDSAASST